MGFLVCTCTNYTQDRNLECEELIKDKLTTMEHVFIVNLLSQRSALIRYV